jgi:hypothetical protein
VFFDVDGAELFIGYFDTFFVGVCVDAGADGKTSFCCSGADVLD